MREIKFRAWDGSNFVEKMRVGELELFDDMLAFRFQHFDCDPSEVIFEQYTGLKDKNGREIYEGDIVRQLKDDCENCDYDVICHSENCHKKEVLRDVVTLERFRFWLKNESFGYEGENRIFPDECEIIGNIHENPELLK